MNDDKKRGKRSLLEESGDTYLTIDFGMKTGDVTVPPYEEVAPDGSISVSMRGDGAFQREGLERAALTGSVEDLRALVRFEVDLALSWLARDESSLLVADRRAFRAWLAVYERATSKQKVGPLAESIVSTPIKLDMMVQAYGWA